MCLPLPQKFEKIFAHKSKYLEISLNTPAEN